MRTVSVVAVVVALILAACGDDDVAPPVDTEAPTTTTTAAATGTVPAAPISAIAVGGEVFPLVIEECLFGDELHDDLLEAGFQFAAIGFVAGAPDSVFEVDRVDYPVYGLEDLALVIVGDEDEPDAYWEASRISHEDLGLDILFLEVDGRTIRGRAWFENMTDMDADFVEGTIEIRC